MAQATTLPFSGVKVMLESTTTPGTYVAPCGLTERSITLTKETNDVNTPDCTNEDAASWIERTVASKSVTISGEGVLARESLPRWQAAWEDDDGFNARVEIAGTALQGGGHYTGKFHLTSYEIGATKGERVTVSVELASDGAVPFTPAVS